MRKFLVALVLTFFSATAITTFSSCSPKVGCELNQGLTPKTNRKGQMSTKKGKSQLFSKRKRKRMGR